MNQAARIYRVIFHSQGKIYEVYARGVSDGALMGFVEIEELTFGERTQVVVDPAEEKLKSEFSGVKRTYIPMHAIMRIDEVEKEGTAKVSETDSKVTPFPMPFYGPSKGSD